MNPSHNAAARESRLLSTAWTEASNDCEKAEPGGEVTAKTRRDGPASSSLPFFMRDWADARFNRRNFPRAASLNHIAPPSARCGREPRN